MSEQTQEKIVYVATHGPEDPERASLPFVLGNAALAMEVEAIVILQGPSVLLACGDCKDHVFSGGLPPLSELMESFVELGGKIYVCGPCIESRQIKEDDFIKGAEVVTAGVVTDALLTANAVVSY